MIYGLLIEHATQEQVDDIDKTLDADMDARAPDPQRERLLLAALGLPTSDS